MEQLDKPIPNGVVPLVEPGGYESGTLKPKAILSHLGGPGYQRSGSGRTKYFGLSTMRNAGIPGWDAAVIWCVGAGAHTGGGRK